MSVATHPRPFPPAKKNPSPWRPLVAFCVLALAAGLSNTAGAAPFILDGATYGPPGPTLTGQTDYVLVTGGAEVNGDLTNDAAGTIDGDDSHSALGIYDGSSVTGAVVNQGSIGASALANYAIEIRDSTIGGGIRNEGQLASAYTALIVAPGSGAFSGGIVNAGEINAGAEGIAFTGTALPGGISNSGTITSTLTGIAIEIDDPNDPGFGTLGGGIANSGAITSEDNAAIRVYAGTLTGGLTNTATATLSAPNDSGVYLDVGTIQDGVSNAGMIDSKDSGIEIRGTSLVGGFSNTGTIASTDGDGVALVLDSLSGDIENSGTLTANSRDGLAVNVATLDGKIVNADSIQADEGNGILIDSGAVVTGELRNAAGGRIAAQTGIALGGGARVSGELINDGTIEADVSIEVAEDAESGDVLNTGTLKGALSIAGQNANGGGIALTNNGSIDLGDRGLDPGAPAFTASLVSGDFTQTDSGTLAITILTFAEYAGMAPLTILGDALIAGDLLLDFDADFIFEPFARMTLIDIGGTRTGWFGNLADQALVRSFGDAGALYIEYTADGDIELYTTPLPPTWLLIGCGLLGWRWRGRRRAAPGLPVAIVAASRSA